MGKKARKNRFNKAVDVDVIYSSNTIADVDPTDHLAELNITKEKAEELQKIRAKLPTFSHMNLLEAELAKLPDREPFRAFVHNMAYSSSVDDVNKFFEPLDIVNVNLVGGEGGSRGFCFVDFASRDDLAKALERNDFPLAGRPVNVRIADPNANDRSGAGWNRDRTTQSGGRRGGGYRPASLRNDIPDSSDGGGEWRRGISVNQSSDSRPSFGFSRPLESRAPPPPRSSEMDNERPKLNLAPPSADGAGRKSSPTRNANIFGSAKPVDTASKDREIEGRLTQQPAAGIR